MTQSGAETNPTHEEQIRELYLKQQHILDLFLERGAISREQYDKSLHDMKEKMGIEE